MGGIVQINVYGATLAGMLHNGVNLPRILKKCGYNDCVVFDVPRRMDSGEHSMLISTAGSFNLFRPEKFREVPEDYVKEEPIDEEIAVMNERVAALMNCSISTIAERDYAEVEGFDLDSREDAMEENITPTDVKPLVTIFPSLVAHKSSNSVAGNITPIDVKPLPMTTFPSVATRNSSNSVAGNITPIDVKKFLTSTFASAVANMSSNSIAGNITPVDVKPLLTTTFHSLVAHNSSNSVAGYITPIDVKPLLTTTFSSAVEPNPPLNVSNDVADCIEDLLDRVANGQPHNSNETAPAVLPNEAENGSIVEATATSFQSLMDSSERPSSRSPSFLETGHPLSSPTPTSSAPSLKKEQLFSVKKKPFSPSEIESGISPMIGNLKSEPSEGLLPAQPVDSTPPAPEAPLNRSAFRWPYAEVTAAMDLMPHDWDVADFGGVGGVAYGAIPSARNGCYSFAGNPTNGNGESAPMPSSRQSIADEFFDCALSDNDNDAEYMDLDDVEEFQESHEKKDRSIEVKASPSEDTIKSAAVADDDNDMDEFLDPFDMNVPPAKIMKVFKEGKKFKCHFKRCRMEIFWKPGYGRNRFLNHVQTHWDRDVLQCTHCEFKGSSESKMRYHHRKNHAGKTLKMVNCETAEDARELHKLWKMCFPQVTKNPTQLLKRLNPHEKKKGVNYPHDHKKKGVTCPSNLAKRVAK